MPEEALLCIRYLEHSENSKGANPDVFMKEYAFWLAVGMELELKSYLVR